MIIRHIDLVMTLLDVAKETGIGNKDRRGSKQQWADFLEYFNFKTRMNRRHVMTLCSTALTWFFL